MAALSPWHADLETPAGTDKQCLPYVVRVQANSMDRLTRNRKILDSTIALRQDRLANIDPNLFYCGHFDLIFAV